MGSADHCLGICFADQQLFYAVNDPPKPGFIRHIGSIDFNFPVPDAVSNTGSENFEGLQRSISRLQETYACESIRILSPASFECWSICPRLVYETSDEREDHIAVLMGDLPRSDIESTWHELSNPDYKLLMLRNRNLTENYRTLSGKFSQTDFVSEFELGMEWQHHTGIKGSYLTIHCQPDHLAISSYILGKLRGATFIRFDTLNDLPYLWSYYARQLNWMNGIHEQVYVYGQQGFEAAEIMAPFFGATGQVILMNNLDEMNVQADESTYGFKLESSFPAVILSLNLPELNEKGK